MVKLIMQVPKELQPFLPSSSVDALEARRDAFYIIESLLRSSDAAGWKWMLSSYSKQDIAEVVKDSKTLKPKNVAAMAVYFNLPKSEILCTQTKSPNPRGSSWVY